MTAAAAALLAAAAVTAAVDWWAVAAKVKRLEYVCQPATVLLLAAAALSLDPQSGGQRAWFVAALLLCAAGDVFLMLRRERFVAGLASFLLGHLAYIAGFISAGRPGTAGLVAGLLIVVNALGIAGTRVVAALRAAGDTGLIGPVVVYMLAIAAMTVLATGSGRVAAGIGAVLFLGSDTLIALNRFVRPLGWAPLAIIVTYHLGQAGLVVSLAR